MFFRKLGLYFKAFVALEERHFGSSQVKAFHMLTCRSVPLLRTQSSTLSLTLLRKYKCRFWRNFIGKYNVRTFSTSALKWKGGIQEHISALQAKKRVPRNKTKVGENINATNETWQVAAYSTAEEYNLDEISKHFDKQGVYQKTEMPDDVIDVLRITPKYKIDEELREFYLFKEGSAVFWNVSESEILSVLQFLKKFENNSYEESIIEQESEIMEYSYTDNKTALKAGKFLLNTESSELVKYTFSNAMALSVKLAIWEASLDQFVDSFESISENMKEGKNIGMSRDQVFKKTGELFSLRHLINLSSDLLDTPDVYWDRNDLENLYIKTCSHLSTTKRTKVMNEKLNYCCELMDLLTNHLNDKHHVRLEWMIITLIMIEVGFECLHYADKLL